MKVQWLQKFDNEHKDSIWYGGDIVNIQLGRYSVTIGAYGDVRAIINGNYYCDKCNGGNFKDYLKEENINNDKELKQALEENRINWENNNWFEAYIWDNKKKDYIETYDTIIDELDANDDFKWLKSWLKELIR